MQRSINKKKIYVCENTLKGNLCKIKWNVLKICVKTEKGVRCII